LCSEFSGYSLNQLRLPEGSDKRSLLQVAERSRSALPLAKKFPSADGQSFVDGRLRSFRHYFVSMCAANNVPERVVMEWVGYADSSTVRHYFHLHDGESQRRMNGLSLFGGVGGRSVG